MSLLKKKMGRLKGLTEFEVTPVSSIAIHKSKLDISIYSVINAISIVSRNYEKINVSSTIFYQFREYITFCTSGIRWLITAHYLRDKTRGRDNPRL